jgi:hypothetical protein
MFEYNNGDDIIGFSTWKNNKRNGWWIDYNYRNEYFGSPTKKLLPMSKTWYENGEKNGIGIQWWDNGRIHDILEFRNGYPIGVWKIWDRYHDVFETVTHGEEGRILDIHAETRQRPQEEVEKEKMDERRANGVIDTTPKEKSRRRSGKKSRKKSTIDRNQKRRKSSSRKSTKSRKPMRIKRPPRIVFTKEEIEKTRKKRYDRFMSYSMETLRRIAGNLKVTDTGTREELIKRIMHASPPLCNYD